MSSSTSDNHPADPKDKKTDVPVRNMSDPDRLRIYAEAGGFCCFPGCDDFLVEDEGTTSNSGQIAHIRGRQPNAARHDPNYPSDKLDSFDNTVLLCYRHHHRIDAHSSRDQFPTSSVEQMKATASEKFSNLRRVGEAGPQFELIDELCLAIADSTAELEFDDSAVKTSEKIRINQLPPPIATMINLGLAQRKTVEGYLAIKADTDTSFPERVQCSIKARYFDLVGNGFPKADIYKIMIVIIRGKEASIERTNTAQAVLAYFFHMCDIFDRS